MAFTATQRAALTWASRPPGPSTLWYAVGSAVRSVGNALDAAGLALQGDCGYVEKLPVPCTAVKISGKAPAVDAAAFVAPSANVLGAVTLGKGASVWYSSLVKGDTAAVSVGDMSAIGDRAVVTGSIIGSNVLVGAGSVVASSTVGDGSSLGMGCKVGKGCTIGAGAVIAGGSVLPPGTDVPAGQFWAGAPAAFVGAVSEEEAAGLMENVQFTSALGGLHQEEAWKPPALIEQDLADYKVVRYRTPHYITTMRYDPGWVPMKTLGDFLEEKSAYDLATVPK